MTPYATRSDEALLVAARTDADAFAELYDRHAPALAAWLVRRSNAHVGQELLGETFAHAWCHRRRYRPAKGPPRAWLHGIAQPLLHDWYRRHAVEQRSRLRLAMRVDAPAAIADDAIARADAAARRGGPGPALCRRGQGMGGAVALRGAEGVGFHDLGGRLRCPSPAGGTRPPRRPRA